jgi:hypothetical protein
VPVTDYSVPTLLFPWLYTSFTIRFLPVTSRSTQGQ